MTREETKKILEMIRITYPNQFKNLSVETLRVMLAMWEDAFKDIPYAVVGKAIKSFIYGDDREFPPNIGQVRNRCLELACPDAGSQAEDAWGEVIAAVRSCYPPEARDDYAKLPELTRKAIAFSEFRVLITNTTENNDKFERPKFIENYIKAIKDDRFEALNQGRFAEIADSGKLKALGISNAKEIGYDTEKKNS